MSKRRYLRWHISETVPSKRRLRDTLIVYAAFSVVVFILGVALGRGVGRTLAIAGAVFVLSSLWAIYRLRRQP